MNEAFLPKTPHLAAVFYGAGSIRGFVTPALWKHAIGVTSAYAANAVPVPEYALATILFSLKHGWQFAMAIKRDRRYPSNLSMAGNYGSTVGSTGPGMVRWLVKYGRRAIKREHRFRSIFPYREPMAVLWVSSG